VIIYDEKVNVDEDWKEEDPYASDNQDGKNKD